MEFTSLTRDVEIGANSYWLRTGGKNLILDSGLHPTEAGLDALPHFSLVPEGSVDGIVITHAHQDHIGSLPVLTRREQVANVFLTEATYRLGEIMLHNSVSVMMHQRDEVGAAEYPLFTHRGIDFSQTMWRRMPVGQPFQLDGSKVEFGTDDVTLEFFHAGHILGSVGVLVRSEGRTLFYTGDVNFSEQTLMLPAAFPENGVDILVMEATRGDSPQAEGFTREGEEIRFAEAIRDAFKRGGSVTAPVFALGKTQEVLAMLWKMQRKGLLTRIPIFIGGLSTKITAAYDGFAHCADRTHSQLILREQLAPSVLSGQEVQSSPIRKRAMYALSSGMMTEKTLSNVFVRRILGDPKQSLFFVGYSDPDSPAGRIRNAKPGDMVVLDEGAPPVQVRCHIESFQFSAHASRESLRAYAVRLKPKKILLVHGDRAAVGWMQARLQADLPGTEVIVPEPGVTLAL